MPGTDLVAGRSRRAYMVNITPTNPAIRILPANRARVAVMFVAHGGTVLVGTDSTVAQTIGLTVANNNPAPTVFDVETFGSFVTSEIWGFGALGNVPLTILVVEDTAYNPVYEVGQ